eukprot:scaffold7808_cov184-Amphora_coffeaeformis.AAC.31
MVLSTTKFSGVVFMSEVLAASRVVVVVEEEEGRDRLDKKENHAMGDEVKETVLRGEFQANVVPNNNSTANNTVTTGILRSDDSFSVQQR